MTRPNASTVLVVCQTNIWHNPWAADLDPL